MGIMYPSASTTFPSSLEMLAEKRERIARRIDLHLIFIGYFR